MSPASGPVITPCIALISPPDTTDWKSDNRLLYELTKVADPERLDRSSTKSLTAPTPPLPPPPQAVRVNPAKPDSNVFFSLDLIFIILPP